MAEVNRRFPKVPTLACDGENGRNVVSLATCFRVNMGACEYWARSGVATRLVIRAANWRKDTGLRKG